MDTLTDEAYAAIREKADMELVKATLSEDKPIISFTYTTPDYLAKTEREKLVVYIRKEPVSYTHLDVYKRQRWHSVVWFQGKQSIVFWM